MTGRHGVARDRIGPGEGRSAHVRGLFFVGFLLFLMTLRPQRGERAVRATSAGDRTDGLGRGGRHDPRAPCERALRGRPRPIWRSGRVPGRAARSRCSSRWCILDRSARRRRIRDRPARCSRTGHGLPATSDCRRCRARAGVWQGLVGSLMLMMFVVVIAFPLGIGAADLHARSTRATPDSPGSSTRTSATWPACRRSCTDCSVWRSS